MEYNVDKYGNVSLPNRDRDMLKVGHTYVGLSCIPFVVECINDVDDEMVEYVVRDDTKHYLTIKHSQIYLYKEIGGVDE